MLRPNRQLAQLGHALALMRGLELPVLLRGSCRETCMKATNGFHTSVFST